MRVIIISALLLGCVYAQNEDEQQEVQQFVKTVKGGPGQGNWEPFNPSSEDLVRIFQNGNPQDIPRTFNMRKNLTGSPPDLDVGVCYIEVPTASLVRGGGQIPAGNGSQPHLSRIRSCCKGYIRNIYNFKKCDPVCTEECVNALCTAPGTCTCFPDHVKNLAGFCIPTCPIGCQNGNCAGGECLCKEGFKLDNDSKYCLPTCKENCGGIGNCTAPNTCDCKTGYHSTPEGSCKPTCEKCNNGECVAPNECVCKTGFVKDVLGMCIPHCGPGFKSTPNGCEPVCKGCEHGDCLSPGTCICHQGYVLEGGSNAGCVPLCTPACGLNSRCIAPNVCDPPIRQPFMPQPNQPQPNGPQPIQPYQTNPLFPDNQNVVPEGVPQCAQPCLNGFCAGGNRCNCNPGYVPDRVDPNRCIPFCPSGCPNGVCSAPNFCICNAGYQKDHSVKGRPTCVKRSKRSTNEDERPVNVADLLIFEIPDY